MAESIPSLTGPAIPGVTDLAPIARGGFATVYRGWQDDYHRQVAVKVIDITPDEAALERFRREVKAMGAVSDHPNAVPIYEWGTTDGRPYLVMPLLEGGSLDDEMRRYPLRPADVVDVGIAIAEILAAAHAIGLIHRDVKPANIFRTPWGHAKLGDFGIARFDDATVTRGQLVATVAYTAPEVLSGAPATPLADEYALGASLHAALRGEAPFTARPDETPVALALRAVQDPLPPLDGVPAALRTVISRATAKQPADRYPSLAAFRDALRDASQAVAIADTVTVATPQPLPPLSPRPVPRAVESRSRRGNIPRRATALGIATGIALAVLIAGGVALAARGGTRAHHPTSAAQAPPSTTPATAPTTTRAPAPTTPLTKPPGPVVGAAAPTPAAATPTAITHTVTGYYGLIDAHRTAEAWSWLTPAYQRQTGEASYQGFWSTIARVDVLTVTPSGDTAAVTLRYTRSDGTVSVEQDTLTFAPGPSGHLLIAGYQPG